MIKGYRSLMRLLRGKVRNRLVSEGPFAAGDDIISLFQSVEPNIG